MRPPRQTILSAGEEAQREVLRQVGRYQLEGWPDGTREIKELTESLTKGESE